MSANVPKVRLYVEAALSAGATVTATAAQAHYLGRVLRLRAGDAVRLFNGADGEWRAVIADGGRGRLTLCAERPRRPQRPEPGPWLLFAPVKRAAVDLMAEKATELGAETLWPVVTGRSNASRVGLDRLHAIAVEAAEQCGRLTVPAMRPPVGLAELAAGWPSTRPLVVLDETGGGGRAVDVLAEVAAAAGEAPGVLVGPEGGWSVGELAALTALPSAWRVGLGPRILRAETAAIAALVCWQAVAGDW
jgi:16S rRNA (uracil1498-N3)-methyltransferase